MLNYRFIFVSKDDKFKLDRDLTEKFTDENPSCRFDYVSCNATPLAVVYNMILNEADTKDFDYVVFMHSDVQLDLKGFITHLEQVHGTYDVIGLAGCAKFSVSQSPLNWFCGSHPFPNDRWGCVSHGELGNQTSFFSQRYPEVTDHEVACIDGLCMVFSRKAIDSGLRFDETFGGYDFYDTDTCYSAIMKYGLKIGVIVRPDLMHYSIGRSILTKGFLETELKFRKKWNLAIPQNSPIFEKVLGINPQNLALMQKQQNMQNPGNEK
jgi:hypothetical protein